MTLAEYLKKHSLTDEEFALRIEASPFAVKKWRYRERVPRLPMIFAIVRATKGEVTATDFLPAEVA